MTKSVKNDYRASRFDDLWENGKSNLVFWRKDEFVSGHVELEVLWFIQADRISRHLKLTSGFGRIAG